MSEKKKVDFDKIWESAKEFGDDLRGITEELVDLMKKEGISETIQIRFIEIFRQIDILIDFVCETKLGIDPFKRWHRNKFLKHAHHNGEVLVSETEPNVEE